jgi:Tat protein translocase TatB subunit
MFGISFTEIIVVFMIALLLFGPEQLPQMARQLGKLMSELRKGSDSVRREFYNSVYPPAQEFTKDFASAGKDLRALKSELLQAPKIPSVNDIINEVKSDLSSPPTAPLPPGGGRSVTPQQSNPAPPASVASNSPQDFDDEKGDA